MKLAKQPVNDKNTASCQTNNVSQALKQKGLKRKKTEFEKLFRLTSCQKPQLQSVSNFFKFVHPCFLLYLLCFIYLFAMFWAVTFSNLKVLLSLMAVLTVWNFVNGFVTQRLNSALILSQQLWSNKLPNCLSSCQFFHPNCKNKGVFYSSLVQIFSNCSNYLLTFLRLSCCTWMQ